MTLYLVTPDNPRVPAVRLLADDLVDLGTQAASYLARHKQLHRGVRYDAQIGSTAGAIHQAGLTKPVTFTVEAQS